MARTLGHYAAELLKYGGISLVALALSGALLGGAQLLLDLGHPLNGWILAVMVRPILGMLAIGGFCWAIGHMMLREARPARQTVK